MDEWTKWSSIKTLRLSFCINYAFCWSISKPSSNCGKKTNGAENLLRIKEKNASTGISIDRVEWKIKQSLKVCSPFFGRSFITVDWNQLSTDCGLLARVSQNVEYKSRAFILCKNSHQEINSCYSLLASFTDLRQSATFCSVYNKDDC